MKPIGIELEAGLINAEGKMVEPSLYGFEYRDETDEMGFLLEIRVPPSDNPKEIFANAFKEISLVDYKARKKGMQIRFSSHYFKEKVWIADIAEKYNIYAFECYAKNIYGTKKNHHLGIFPVDENEVLLTAGIHVHFASDKGFNMNQVEKIVKMMDEARPDYIKEAKRIKGEYELKVVEGSLVKRFEYRSYPNKHYDLSMEEYLFDVLRVAFEIYHKVIEG